MQPIDIPPFVTLAPLIALLIYAALSDLSSLRIPNLASAGIAALFPLHALIAGNPSGLAAGLLVGAIAFAAGILVFALRLAGAGDVKMFAAVALWAGPQNIAEFIMVTTAAGGFFALLMMSPVGVFIQARNGGLSRPTLVMPYGVAIAIGGLFIVFKLLRP